MENPILEIKKEATEDTSNNLLEVIKQEEYLILDDPEIEVKERSSLLGLLKQNNLKTQQAEEEHVEITNEAYYVVLNNMYRCTICPFGTKELAKIERHFKDHDISRVSRAPYDLVGKEMCKKLNDYQYEFRDTRFQCKVCEFRSFGHEAIKRHVDKFHINVSSKCEVCNKFFGLTIVVKVHHLGRITSQYKCLKCEYTSFEPLAKHMESHPNKCSECDATSSKQLAKQMENCTTDTISYCNLCGCKCEIISAWNDHLKYHLDATPRAISILKNAQYVYEHYEKRFQCNLCKYNSSSHRTMKEHVDRLHLNVRHNQCELCGKRFFSSNGLNRHMRRHTGEKPYKCTECDYASSVSISKHMKIHNKIKPYHCNVCEYKSPEPGRLKLHMRSHTGEKPFKCLICDYAATNKAGLVNHMKKKHTNAA